MITTTLDTRKLEDAVVKVLAHYVGEGLSTLNTVTGTIPAVYRARIFSDTKVAPPIPDYPYALVSLNTTYPDSSERTQAYWDWNSAIGRDQYITEIHSIASLNVTFYGSSENPVDGLAQKWHSVLELDQVIDAITTLYDEGIYDHRGGNCILRNKSRILPTDSVVEDKFLEIRAFDMFFAIKDIVATDIEYFTEATPSSHLFESTDAEVTEEYNDHLNWLDADNWSE